MKNDDEVPARGPAAQSSNVPAPIRRFGDEEITRILHKAAELQERSSAISIEGGRGLTLEELRQIAREAGIDPRFVDLAASDSTVPVQRFANRLAGAACQWHYEATVPGEIRDAERELILHTVRSILGQKGELADVFGRMEWSHNDGAGPVIVGIASRDGCTEVDVSAVKFTEAGTIHGLGVPTGGLVGGAVAAGILGLSGPAAVLPLIAAGSGAAYLGLRLVWRARSRWWERRLARVLERVTSIVQGATRPPTGDGER